MYFSNITMSVGGSAAGFTLMNTVKYETGLSVKAPVGHFYSISRDVRETRHETIKGF